MCHTYRIELPCTFCSTAFENYDLQVCGFFLSCSLPNMKLGMGEGKINPVKDRKSRMNFSTRVMGDRSDQGKLR